MDNTSHGAWFLGPKAEYYDVWEKFIVHILSDHSHWRRNYFPEDNTIISRGDIRQNEPWVDSLSNELDKILAAFKSTNPTYSPRYLAHMMSEQSLPSILGYFAGLLYNSNNVSGESSPAAVPMELEVGRMVAQMLGYDPATAWTHITSGGTVANIEALWVARTVKFTPFIIRELCQGEGYSDFLITTANGQRTALVDCSDRALLGLGSYEAIFINRQFTAYLIDRQGKSIEEATDQITSHTKTSDFNIIRVGLHRILQRLGVEPVIFVSPSAHYSIKKAANILGYGECSIKIIDVDHRFRINTDLLTEAVNNLADNQYIAAVISISGTTEEGAIDPLHTIVDIRRQLAQTQNRSFWLHIDSAWGGYIRSLFSGYPIDKELSLEQAAMRCKEVINTQMINSTDEVLWQDELGVYMSLLSYGEAESITIDPHKLGYIPYAAGIVSFKHSVVTELIKQEAPYIFHGKDTFNYQTPPVITEVGSYILEGSKPGAAAASCYLAHKTIPLRLDGHGKIIKATLQSTIKLQRLFESHHQLFDQYAQKAALKMRADQIKPSGRKFTIIPLHRADSNLICYVIRPVVAADNERGWQVDRSMSLSVANQINQLIYQKMSIDHNNLLHSTQSYDYFVSKTLFSDDLYSYESLGSTLDNLGIDKQQYINEGLFVLRTTVMNPFYPIATAKDKEYLDQYVACLHANAESALGQ